MLYQFTAISLILLFVALMAASLGVMGWRRRMAGAWALALLMMSAALGVWMSGYGMELAALTFGGKRVWTIVQTIGAILVPLGWFLFVIYYVGWAYWLTRRRLLLLSFPALLFAGLAITNGWHHLVWRELTLTLPAAGTPLLRSYGPAIWLGVTYTYGLTAAGLLLFFTNYPKATIAFRGQRWLILLGVMTPWSIHLLYLINPAIVNMAPFAAVGFSVTIICFAEAVRRYRMLDLVPIARTVMLNHVQDGMLAMDKNGRLVDANQIAHRLFATTPWFIGSHVTDLLAPYPELVESLQQGHLGTQFQAKNGRYYEFERMTVRNVLNMPQGQLLLFRDITTYKQKELALADARDKAIEASQFKSRLLARVSHDLRIPLNIVLAYAEMLQDGVYGSITNEQWQPISHIIQNAVFLNRQVNDLLDMSRLENGDIHVEFAPFSPHQLIDRVCWQMDVVARAKQLQLVCLVEKELPELLFGNSQRLEQILFNLIDNAIKYTERGGVQVHARLFGEAEWQIEVADSGIGIPEEMHQQIFEPFQQVNQSATRTEQGMGLGLSIVRELLQAMGGRIVCDSRLGEGSRFTVTFPLTLREQPYEQQHESS